MLVAPSEKELYLHLLPQECVSPSSAVLATEEDLLPQELLVPKAELTAGGLVKLRCGAAAVLL